MNKQVMHTSISHSSNKLIGLEVLRFICALSVLFWHYQHFFYISDKPVNFVKNLQPFYLNFSVLYNYGYYAVQIFWCISGFIFFWHYRSAIVRSQIDCKRFFILRFSRLYPLHFFTLIVVLILQFVYFTQNGEYFVYQYNDFKHLILQVFFASNWGLQDGDSFNGPIWSVSVEILIYLLFYSTIKLFKGSYFINITILCIYIALKYINLTPPKIDPIMNCIGLFYLGGLSAIVFKFLQNKKYFKSICYFSTIASISTLIVILKFKLFELSNFSFKFISIYTPLILFTLAQNIKLNSTIQRAFQLFGNLTYSSYLIHFPIQLCTVILLGYLNEPVPYYSSWFFLFYILTTFTCSYFLYKYFEMPMQSLIRRNSFDH